MSVLYVALPVALALGALAVIGFTWATRGGQFDDLETPRWRVLTDDKPLPKTAEGKFRLLTRSETEASISREE